MRRLLRILLPVAALAASALAVPAAQAASVGVSPAREFAPRQLLVKFEGQRVGRALSLAPGAGVRRTARALRRNPRVVYAEPNYIATASAPRGAPLDPDDPGTLGGASGAATELGDWAYKQWNFLSPEGLGTPQLPTSPGGIDAVGAWRNLIEAGRPGAAGIVVAVLDTGVAYRSFGTRFRRSPDFGPGQFVAGHDFVAGDRFPLDENGHGTHVAGTIAEKTDNGVGLTGLAYRAKLMPIRVLDRNGRGDALDIVKGIRFAIAHRAQVINMSFNFGCGKRVPLVDEALREAYERGIVTVASAGNLGSETCVSPPATGPRVIGVGGTTEGACLGDYSLAGTAIDLLAPGGGIPQDRCPSVAARPIYQVTLHPGSTKTFAIPATYVGTSMAAAHVSGVAAMVLATGSINPLLPPRRRVEALTRQLRQSARDLGLPATQQGAGLINAAAATEIWPRFSPPTD
ncbi:MAG TPA: S8 family serine peptidase [Solirubrobacterales bacterium]|nr:S8 family serine peptidase [Solirubrobacterales bacterium]